MFCEFYRGPVKGWRRKAAPRAVAACAAAAVLLSTAARAGAPEVHRSLTAEDYAAGYALVRIGTGEDLELLFDELDGELAWSDTGASEDWTYLDRDVFTNAVNPVAFVDGYFRPDIRDPSRFVAPLECDLGFAPASAGLAEGESGFVYGVENSSETGEVIAKILYWKNAYLGGSSISPVSVQAWIGERGYTEFRYDFSAVSLYNEKIDRLVRVGFGDGDRGLVYDCIPTGITSLRFARLDPAWADDPDPDGDGISTEDEIFVYGTDPGNADTDGDGLSDGEEILETGTDPLAVYSRCGYLSDKYAVALGTLDPFSCPAGSTNTVWEHIFYSGTADGAFTYPQTGAGDRILTITTTGFAEGELIVGDRHVPLIGPDFFPAASAPAGALAASALSADAGDAGTGRPTSVSVSIPVPQGKEVSVWYKGKGDAEYFQLGSSDFCAGCAPTLLKPRGWIAFPYTEASPACIHNLVLNDTEVSLDPGKIDDITCTWNPTAMVAAENLPPRSAKLTGKFSRDSEAPITYTLDHPAYLSGAKTYEQSVRYCPANYDESEHSYGENFVEPESEHVLQWCDEHNCYYSECRNEHLSRLEGRDSTEADDETDVFSLPEAPGVLKIHEPAETQSIYLEVASGVSQCCGCPSHTRTNKVELAGRSGNISVKTSDGDDFQETTESCVVQVEGVLPSAEVNDAHLYFSKTGAVYEAHAYTALGLGIEGEGIYETQLREIVAKAPDCRYPVFTGTHSGMGTVLKLRTTVRLAEGEVRLSIKNAKGRFLVYLGDACGTREKLIDTAEGNTFSLSLAEWKAIADTSNGVSYYTWIVIQAEEIGSCDLEFSYALRNGDAAITDKRSLRLAAIAPPMMPDYNHDGKIDSKDDAIYNSGRPYRFWANEETISGDCFDNDNTTEDDRNSNDDRINGRYDLVNFFPVALRCEEIFTYLGENCRLRIYSRRGYTDHCFVDVPWNEAGSLQTTALKTCSGEALEKAKLIEYDYDVPVKFVGGDGFGIDRGVVFCEARYAGSELEMAVFLDKSELMRFPLNMKIVNVRDMYRWVNLRSVAGQEGSGEASMTDSPAGYPDDETDDRNYVFVHGFNVTAKDARRWGDRIFKRLWQAGSTSKFTAVDWYGDSGHLWLGDETECIDYYENVINAFATAKPMCDELAKLPGMKVMLAHSLGNVLTSSAAAHYNLDYERYYMLNPAVPIEAYDSGSFTSNMVDSAFDAVDKKYWSANWSELFGEDDARSTVSWRGIFAGIHDAVNCYSPTEDVLKNASANGFGGAWAKQELFKGTTVWPSILLFTWEHVESEGGWGINSDFMCDPTVYLPGVGYYPRINDLYTPERAITNTLFTAFGDKSLMVTNRIESLPDTTKWKLLADAIPATSFAAAANEMNSVKTGIEEWNYEEYKSGNWPRTSFFEEKWYHSDIGKVAYFYLHGFYERIIQNENQAKNNN